MKAVHPLVCFASLIIACPSPQKTEEKKTAKTEPAKAEPAKAAPAKAAPAKAEIGSACSADGIAKVKSAVAKLPADVQRGKLVMAGLGEACTGMPEALKNLTSIPADPSQSAVKIATALGSAEGAKRAEKACPGFMNLMRTLATVPPDQRAMMFYDTCSKGEHFAFTREEWAKIDESLQMRSMVLCPWLKEQNVDLCKLAAGL